MERAGIPSTKSSNPVEQTRGTSDANLLQRETALADFIENAPVAIHGVDKNGTILWANRAELKLLGYAREEYVGHNISEFHADEPVIADILQRLKKGEELREHEARLRACDGSIRHVAITSNVHWEDGQFVNTRCFTRDVTERTDAGQAQRAIERQLVLLLEASSALLESPHSADVVRRIPEIAVQFIEADAYAVWRKQRDGTIWKLIVSRGLSESYERTAYEQAGPGPPLPSEPLAIEDVQQFPLLHSRAEFYRAEGIRSMLTVPLRIHGEIAGSIVFYHRQAHRFSAAEVRMGAALGNLTASALGTAELYDRQLELRSQAELAQRQASFLAESGAVLSSSLEYETTLRRVAETAVPTLADWCAVDLLDDEGELRPVALAHQDPMKVEFAEEFRRRYPPREMDPSLTVLRTGQSLLVEELSEEALVQGARSPEHLQDVRALAITSFIVVPMLTRGRTLGSLTFVSAESGRRYTAADLAFAEELARRAAIAIDNARLHAEVSASEARFRFLSSLDDATRALTDPNEITVTVARLVAEHLGVNRCAYAEVEADGNSLAFMGEYNKGVPPIAGHYAVNQLGVDFGGLCRAGAPYVVEDSETDSRTAEVREFYRIAQIRALISSPLRKEGRFVAAIAVHQSTPRRWRSDEVGLMQLVANRCWESIERARVTRVLGQSEEQFRTLAEMIPNLAWMADEAGDIFWYNRRWYDYTGTTFDEMKGWGWQTVHDPAVLPGVMSQWKSAIASGNPFEMVFPLRGADGTFRSFLTRVEPVKDDQGRVFRWFGSNTDITDQRRTEEELRKINRELEEFVYVASHDLQEPLRMVNIYSQLLLRRMRSEPGEELQQFAGFIGAGVKRMETLIRDLLIYSRERHKRAETPSGTADLNEAVRQALAILQTRILDTGALVTSDPLPVVAGDTEQLAHVFQNLFANALKYRKQTEAPQIHTSASRQNAEWVISVQDNGIGFEQSHAERIFGLFKRLHRDGEYEGTGLGLAICKRIVERYGGRIWAESKEGVGSNFSFTIPAIPE